MCIRRHALEAAPCGVRQWHGVRPVHRHRRDLFGYPWTRCRQGGMTHSRTPRSSRGSLKDAITDLFDRSGQFGVSVTVEGRPVGRPWDVPWEIRESEETGDGDVTLVFRPFSPQSACPVIEMKWVTDWTLERKNGEPARVLVTCDSGSLKDTTYLEGTWGSSLVVEFARMI